MWSRVSRMLTVVLVSLAYRVYTWTWSIRHVRHPKLEGSLLYAHWHGDELALISAYRHSRMAVMASRSKDGELQGRFLEGLGYHVVRGSSSKGGAGGLKGLLDAVMKGGFNASLAVDGPRGPLHQVKPGILKLAQVTRRPLIPGVVGTSSKFVFKKSWNQAFLPLPFSQSVIIYGEPITVPRDADEATLENLRLELEQKLISLKVEAENFFGPEVSKVPLTKSQIPIGSPS